MEQQHISLDAPGKTMEQRNIHMIAPGRDLFFILRDKRTKISQFRVCDHDMDYPDYPVFHVGIKNMPGAPYLLDSCRLELICKNTGDFAGWAFLTEKDYKKALEKHRAWHHFVKMTLMRRLSPPAHLSKNQIAEMSLKLQTKPT